MDKETQKQWVIKQLETKGYISRNECLQNYISRLSDIIFKLKKDGYCFNSYFKNINGGKDFIYEIDREEIKEIPLEDMPEYELWHGLENRIQSKLI